MTLLNLSVYDDDIHYKNGFFSNEIESGIESKSVVAIFNCNSCKVGLERIKTIDKYKYLFYSPTSYSDEFYINPNQIEKCKLNDYIIISNHDTLYNKGRISPITSIPKSLTLMSKDNKTIIARLMKRLDENIETKPKINTKNCKFERNTN